MTSGRYVYGAIASSAAATAVGQLSGVDDAPVELTEHAGLRIACSAVEVDQAWEADLDKLEGRLRQHQSVIDKLFETSAIVPVRFGTVFPSEAAMRRWAQDESERLLKTLVSVDGLAEWVLTVTWDPAVARAQLDSPSDAAEGPATGTAYLRARADEQRASERMEQMREGLAAELHAAAAASAQSSERRAVAGGDEAMVLRASYVLPKEEVDALAGAISSAMADEAALDLHADLSGPWPPTTDGGEWS